MTIMRRIFGYGLAALVAGVVIGLVGALAVWADRPWLFASLGPTVALQTAFPKLRISRPWNVAVGHLCALAAALLAVYITGAAHAPAFSDGHSLVWARVAAASLAISLGLALEFVLKASHVPSASTALLVTLGLITPGISSSLAVIIGIALVTMIGEMARRLCLLV